MKKLTTFLFAAIFLVSFTFGQATPADAAAKSYKNCTELNKVYKGGVYLVLYSEIIVPFVHENLQINNKKPAITKW